MEMTGGPLTALRVNRKGVRSTCESSMSWR
jgi:hypothetical protein